MLTPAITTTKKNGEENLIKTIFNRELRIEKIRKIYNEDEINVIKTRVLATKVLSLLVSVCVSSTFVRTIFCSSI